MLRGNQTATTNQLQAIGPSLPTNTLTHSVTPTLTHSFTHTHTLIHTHSGTHVPEGSDEHTEGRVHREV